jgi:nucleoporin NUP1
MKIAKTAGAVVTSLGLVVGMSAFAGATSGNFTNSGDDNTNTATTTTTTHTTLHNNNNAGVFNLNAQGAESGKAVVHGNSSDGSATTGDASNASNTSTSITVSNTNSNSAALMGSAVVAPDTSATVMNSGDHNLNTVSTTTTTTTNVTNNNNVGVVNLNLQGASSGNAIVHGNSSTGSATTGDVSNTSSTSTSINVSN